ncbi:uncharacterized protein [Parasteatoda tepidariorum]|uniref:uncharacterized protein isoform X1 n=1 Tax=Parasteatoda tepidariorum TaxID=114398 RepID=UPI0039BD9090
MGYRYIGYMGPVFLPDGAFRCYDREYENKAAIFEKIQNYMPTHTNSIEMRSYHTTDVMPMRCFLPGCRTGYDSEVARRKKEGKKNLSLFKAPKDPYMFELWKKAIPRADKTLGPKHTVCELHFREEDIESYFETKLFNGNIHRIFRASKKLKPDAIPCIFSNVPGHSSFVENREEKFKEKYVKRKRKLHSNKKTESKRAKISFPDNETSKNNNSSLKTEKENVLMEVIVVHTLPEKSSITQPSRLKKRRNAKKSTNSSFSDSHKHIMSDPESSTTCSPPAPDTITNYSPRINTYNRILSESFAHDKLAKNFIEQNSSIESPLPDTLTENYSNQNTSNRTIANSSLHDALKDKYSDQNACDIAMTEYPTNDAISDDYSDQSNDDKTMNDFFSFQPAESNSDPIISNSIRTESNDISSDSDTEEQVSFDFIKANVNMFDTRNSWWRVNIFDDFIAFSRWTPDYTVQRRIVITEDLAVKVFLMDRETTIGWDMKKFSIFDIAKLIYRVENLKLCSGIDKKDRNCAGYLQRAFMCRKHSLCLNCIKWRKETKKKAVKRLKKSPSCIELLNFNLIT